MNEAAFEYLTDKAKTHSKMNNLVYSDCEGADYLKLAQFTPDLASLLFKFRTRTYMVKNNFRNNYRNTNIICPLCEISDDTQEHIFRCYQLKKSYTVKFKPEDIYSNNSVTLLQVAKELKQLTNIRQSLLNPETQ